jgi:hypothetical protein
VSGRDQFGQGGNQNVNMLWLAMVSVYVVILKADSNLTSY